MAENISTNGSLGLVGTYDSSKGELDRENLHRGDYASSEQTGHWRRVPYVNILPEQRTPLPVKLLLQSGLALAISLLGFLAITDFMDWKSFDSRAAETRFDTDSVNRRLTDRQNDIQPLQSQISNLSSELEAAESTYMLATSGQADWFATMNGLFSFSDSGVDLLSAEVKSNGTVLLVGAAANAEVTATLPNQLSRLSGVLDLQGIEWDSQSSPPVFTAEFRVSR